MEGWAEDDVEERGGDSSVIYLETFGLLLLLVGSVGLFQMQSTTEKIIKEMWENRQLNTTPIGYYLN